MTTGTTIGSLTMSRSRSWAGSDAQFLTFLTETLHPVVRPDSAEARTLASELNDLLRRDGIELYEADFIGQRPVWNVRTLPSAVSSRTAVPASINVDSEAVMEGEHLWVPGFLRLFLSHTAAHKVDVAALKGALGILGVSAFVAHEDIEPTREWQREIVAALHSAHALAALLTSDFHASKWTDHETGIAIGRGAFVFSVKLPETPYGFLGHRQGLPGDLKQPAPLAGAIVDVLLRRSETEDSMREGLVVALETSANFRDSNTLIAKVITVNGFTSAQLARLERAGRENYEVANANRLGTLRAYIAEQT